MMSMSIDVEQIETGDRIEVWIEDSPKAVRVREITEGVTLRTFQVSNQSGSFELSVERGQAVNLVC